jgi:hypothetical protein
MAAEFSQIIDKVALSKFAAATLQPAQPTLNCYGRPSRIARLPQPNLQSVRGPPSPPPPQPPLRGQKLCQRPHPNVSQVKFAIQSRSAVPLCPMLTQRSIRHNTTHTLSSSMFTQPHMNSTQRASPPPTIFAQSSFPSPLARLCVRSLDAHWHFCACARSCRPCTPSHSPALQVTSPH